MRCSVSCRDPTSWRGWCSRRNAGTRAKRECAALQRAAPDGFRRGEPGHGGGVQASRDALAIRRARRETEAGGRSDAALSLRRARRMGRGVPSPHVVANLLGFCSSATVRLEPLFDDLLPALSSDDRLPGGARLRFSVEVGPSSDFEASPLQLRGVVKNALVEALASRGVASEVDTSSPDVIFVVRRAGTPQARLMVVGVDIGGGARHRRGARGRRARAAARDDGGAADHVVALGRADGATGRSHGGRRDDSDRAAGLAVGAAIRRPSDLPQRQLAAFRDLPHEAPDLFPGTVPKISRSTPTPSVFPRWSVTFGGGADRSRPRGFHRHRATRHSTADS